MSGAKQGNSVWGMIFLIAVLSGGFFWMYQEVSINYQNMENSHRMMEALLENQTSTVRSYAGEIAKFKSNLEETGVLLSQIQAENNQFKQRVAMLDDVAELERKIALLEEQNVKLKTEMDVAALASQTQEKELRSKLQELLDEQNFKTIAEGESLLKKYRARFRDIKARIKGYKMDARRQKIDGFKAKDQADLLAGNNGFLIRNGQPATANVASSSGPKNVQINVTFVK